MESGGKAECEEACSSPVPNLKKRRGKGIERKDDGRGKRNADLHLFLFSIALILFFCSCLIKAVFCHLLYFIPPVTVVGHLLLYDGQWECSWRWAEAWAVLRLMWIRVQINSLTHSRSESEGTWASSLQAPCCASKAYKHVSYSLVCSSMQSSRWKRVGISDLP